MADSYTPIQGFDYEKLRGTGGSPGKYTEAVRTFSRGLASGVPVGRDALGQMVAYARANGFPAANVVGDDKIDFGDGRGPIDVVMSNGQIWFNNQPAAAAAPPSQTPPLGRKVRPPGAPTEGRALPRPRPTGPRGISPDGLRTLATALTQRPWGGGSDTLPGPIAPSPPTPVPTAPTAATNPYGAWMDRERGLRTGGSPNLNTSLGPTAGPTTTPEPTVDLEAIVNRAMQRTIF